MTAEYFTVGGLGIDEFEVQKSRFIGMVQRVETEDECRALIQKAKARWPQARHYCSAWILGAQGLHKRADDDREPQGTAGMPMLQVLEGRCLTNVCCVAIRYFGGVLLGTGGLARAYTKTAVLAVEAAGMVRRYRAVTLSCTLDYTYWDPLQHLLQMRGVPVAKTEYTDRVRVDFYAEPGDCKSWEQEIAALTGATAALTAGDAVWLNAPLKGEHHDKR